MKKYFLLIATMLFLVSAKNNHKTAKDTVFGIDISEYQDGNINLIKVARSNVKFIILRATMGTDRKDGVYQQRIDKVRGVGLIAGAYHYYDPNEPSTKQAENYLSSVKLKKGDFIPIVDLEKFSSVQSTAKLKAGLKNWLDIVEKHYHVKPMLYTSYTFYTQNLAKDFADYPLWVAAYSVKKRNTEIVKNSDVLQFAERVPVSGIKRKVDGDDIKKIKFPKLLLR